jgi:hypothetical protein
VLISERPATRRLTQGGLLRECVIDPPLQPAYLTRTEHGLDSGHLILNLDDAITVGVQLGDTCGIHLSSELKPLNLAAFQAVLLNRPHVRDVAPRDGLTKLLVLGADHVVRRCGQIVVREHPYRHAWPRPGRVLTAPTLLSLDALLASSTIDRDPAVECNVPGHSLDSEPVTS